MAKEEGAIAAPTASLHFSEEILNALKAIGIQCVEITLHVGIGTFAPLSAQHIVDKTLHHESYFISEATANTLTLAKQQGKNIVAVGTTVTRTLESAFQLNTFTPGHGSTSLFIQPGDSFHAIDGLITNFHLPKSSLLMLVSAFAGMPLIKTAYNEAIKERYRFFSFGDAMIMRRPI